MLSARAQLWDQIRREREVEGEREGTRGMGERGQRDNSSISKSKSK